ncbi:MAG: phosphatase PAP2 family protein [Alphaproteobacteria bacterium]|nr:phosphatase PAP2 family protein [Alphaproteobacteria bacterium]
MTRNINISRMAALTALFLLIETALMLFADRPIALWAHGLDTTHHALIDFFRHITNFGKSTWYLWLCGIATILCGFLSRAQSAPPFARRLCAYIGSRALFVFLTIAVSGIVADIFKPIIGRARPVELLRDNLYGFHFFTTAGFAWNSMPSGHTTTAFALGFSLCALYPRLRPLWLAIAVTLGLSRVMVDAHYVSDVCAGAVLGSLTVRVFLAYRKLQPWRVIFPIDTNVANG